MLLLVLNRVLWRLANCVEASASAARGELRPSDAKTAGEAGIALRPHDSAAVAEGVADGDGELELVRRMQELHEDDGI